MSIISMAAVVIGFVATGHVPYKGQDYLVTYLPENSNILSVHRSLKRGTGWFGFDNAPCRGCDALNHRLAWELSRTSLWYKKAQNMLRNAAMSPEAQHALDFYVMRNCLEKDIKAILPNATPDERLKESLFLMNAIENIRLKKDNTF